MKETLLEKLIWGSLSVAIVLFLVNTFIIAALGG